MNVWFGLTYEGHIHHAVARAWFESLPPDARLFFCRVTQLGLLCLLTTEAVMGQEVMSQRGTWDTYDRWFEDDRVRFLAEPPALEQAFRTLSRHRHPAPKDWADSYLAAFALAADLTLITFDRALHGKARQAILLK